MESSFPDSFNSTAGVLSQLSFSHHSFSTASSFMSSNSSDVYLLDPCFGFQFFLNTIFLGFLCVFGFVGNTVSVLVLQRDRHNRVPVFLLQSLAFADNSILLLAFVALSIFYGLVFVFGHEVEEGVSPFIVRFLNPLGYAAQSCTIWITVLIAINRYLAFCRPFTSQKWLTMKHARIQVFVVVFVSVLLNIPRVFDDDIKKLYRLGASLITPIPGATTISTLLVDNTSTAKFPDSTTSLRVPDAYWYFEVVYLNVFYTSVILILPLLLLVGINIPLMRQLQESKRHMIRNSLKYTGQQENNITVVMVIIILEMVVCHLPDRVVQIILFFVSKGNQKCPSSLYYAINIANFLVVLNSSTDFIVYYVFRKRFRTILCDRLLCRRSWSSLRKVDAWNSGTDHDANLRVRLNSNGQGARIQRVEEGDQLRTPVSPENDHEMTSLERKSDQLTTRNDDHRTSLVRNNDQLGTPHEAAHDHHRSLLVQENDHYNHATDLV